MTLCSDNHPEVCYEDRWCPVCALQNEKERDNKELNEKNEKDIFYLIEKFSILLEDAENEIYGLKEQLKRKVLK